VSAGDGVPPQAPPGGEALADGHLVHVLAQVLAGSAALADGHVAQALTGGPPDGLPPGPAGMAGMTSAAGLCFPPPVFAAGPLDQGVHQGGPVVGPPQDFAQRLQVSGGQRVPGGQAVHDGFRLAEDQVFHRLFPFRSLGQGPA
jgi:hypothetical protein